MDPPAALERPAWHSRPPHGTPVCHTHFAKWLRLSGFHNIPQEQVVTPNLGISALKPFQNLRCTLPGRVSQDSYSYSTGSVRYTDSKIKYVIVFLQTFSFVQCT